MDNILLFNAFRKIKMKFNIKNFRTFLLLLFTEIIIAQTTGFIRHTFGDFLVVILLYFLVQSFFKIKPKVLGLAVLLFAYGVELLQSFNFITKIGLQHSKIANIIIGNTFSFGDLIAYTLGVITVVCIETYNPFKIK